MSGLIIIIIVVFAIAFFVNSKSRYEQPDNISAQNLGIDEGDYKAWCRRGIEFEELGRYREAILAYDKALEIQPDNHQIWCAKGRSLANLEKLRRQSIPLKEF